MACMDHTPAKLSTNMICRKIFKELLVEYNLPRKLYLSGKAELPEVALLQVAGSSSSTLQV